MKLFTFENYKVNVEPEALMLKPFKAVWDKDKSKDKHNAMLEFAFIYFYTDPRSDYMYILDKNERKQAIKDGEGLPEKWDIDAKLHEAIEFYESFKPITAALLEDTRFMVDKLRQWLKDIDMTAVDKNDKPIYTINSITSAIKQIPALLAELDAAEKKLSSEMKEVSKARGSMEKKIGEDGISF